MMRLFLIIINKVQIFHDYLPGIKKSSGVDGEIRLQASGFIKDISIRMLSDDNFSGVQLIYLSIFSFV